MSEPVYVKPMTSAADAYYQATIDQIRLITESSDIRLCTAGPRPRDFELCDNQASAKASLAEFLRFTR